MNKDGTTQLYVGAAGVYDSTYSSPDEWLWETLAGGTRSESDIHVSADSALTFAPWFQGISIISGDVARVPLDVFDRDANDDREKRRNHPAFELLNRRANSVMSAFTVRETLLSHALSWGNGYAMIEWQGARPAALVPMMPDVTEPKRTTDGEYYYSTRLEDGSEYTMAPSDVLHVRGLGSGMTGYSVFKYAKNSLGLGLAAERHGSRHFKNDGRPGVILKHPAKLNKPDADTLLDMWETRHGQNPNRPALAAGGLDVMTLPVSNEDSQFIESRKFQRDEVASWLALPPHKLGSDSRLSYNSVEAEERSYVSQTLMRWFKRFEAEADLKLLTEAQKRKWWYFEHNTGALIQGDFATQSKVAVELKNAKIINQNEARKKFNLNSVEGGDKFENANTSSDSQNTSEGQEPPPEQPDDTTEAHRELIVDRMQQLVRSECTSLRRLAKGTRPADAITELYSRFEPKVAAALAVCLKVYRTVARCDASAEQLAARYCQQSKDAIRDVLATISLGQLPGAIDATVEQWPETRPQYVVDWITKGN